MSNVDVMVQMIEADPDNVVGEAMLTDALVEERGMHFTEAAAHVARVIQTARDRRDVARAAHLVAPDSDARPYLLDLMLFGTNVAPLADATVLVIPGDTPPVAHDPAPPFLVGQLWTCATVTVGATWVLNYHRRHVHLWQPLVKAKSKRRPR